MQEHEFEHELGLEVKDKVTGFKGILMWRVQYLTGCDQYGIQGPINDKGELPEPKKFDESRIEVISEGVSKDPAFDFYTPVDIKMEEQGELTLHLPGGPQPFAGK